MRLSSHKLDRTTQLDLPMTSMIDVVFLLLIFFLTTSAFRETERELDVGLEASRNSAVKPGHLQPAIVEIVPVDDGFAYQIGSRVVASMSELEDILTDFTSKEDGAFVKVRNEAPAELAARAVQACRNAEFRDVTYVPVAD